VKIALGKHCNFPFFLFSADTNALVSYSRKRKFGTFYSISATSEKAITPHYLAFSLYGEYFLEKNGSEKK